MAHTAADTPHHCPGRSRARVRANIGLALGLVLGLVLALAEVTVAVPFESDEGQGPKYRVVVLGIVVFRYAEDGALSAMRPWPQARAARATRVRFDHHRRRYRLVRRLRQRTLQPPLYVTAPRRRNWTL
jgi:hypothetical protein